MSLAAQGTGLHRPSQLIAALGEYRFCDGRLGEIGGEKALPFLPAGGSIFKFFMIVGGGVKGFAMQRSGNSADKLHLFGIHGFVLVSDGFGGVGGPESRLTHGLNDGLDFGIRNAAVSAQVETGIDHIAAVKVHVEVVDVIGACKRHGGFPLYFVTDRQDCPAGSIAPNINTPPGDNERFAKGGIAGAVWSAEIGHGITDHCR